MAGSVADMFTPVLHVLNTPIIQLNPAMIILLLIISLLLPYCTRISLTQPISRFYQSISTTWLEMEEDFQPIVEDTIEGYSLIFSFVAVVLMSLYKIIRSVMVCLYMLSAGLARILSHFFVNCWLELERDFNDKMHRTFFNTTEMGSSSPPLTPEQIDANRVAFIERQLKRQLKGKNAVIKQFKADKNSMQADKNFMQQEHGRMGDLIDTLLTEGKKNGELIESLERKYVLQGETLERRTRELGEKNEGLINSQRELETVRGDLSAARTDNSSLQARVEAGVTANESLQADFDDETEARANAEDEVEQLQSKTKHQEREIASLRKELKKETKAHKAWYDRVLELAEIYIQQEEKINCAGKDTKKAEEDRDKAERAEDELRDELNDIKSGKIIISQPAQPQTSAAPQAPIERAEGTSEPSPASMAQSTKPAGTTPPISALLNTKPLGSTSSSLKFPSIKSTGKPTSTPKSEHNEPTSSAPSVSASSNAKPVADLTLPNTTSTGKSAPTSSSEHAKPAGIVPSIFASLNTKAPGSNSSMFKFESTMSTGSSSPNSASDGITTTGSTPSQFTFSNIKPPGKTSPVFKFPDTIPTSTATPAIDLADTKPAGEIFTFAQTQPMGKTPPPVAEASSAPVQSPREVESPVPAPFAETSDPKSDELETSQKAWYNSLNKEQQARADDEILGLGKEKEELVEKDVDMTTIVPAVLPPPAAIPPTLPQPVVMPPVFSPPAAIPPVLPPPATMPPVLPRPIVIPQTVAAAHEGGVDQSDAMDVEIPAPGEGRGQTVQNDVVPPAVIPQTAVATHERGVDQSDAMEVEIPDSSEGRGQSVQNIVAAPVVQAPAAFITSNWSSFKTGPLTTGVPGLGQSTQTPQPAPFSSPAAPPASLPSAASNLSAGAGASATSSSPQQMNALETPVNRMPRRKAPVTDEDACFVKPKSRKKPTPKPEAKPAPTTPAPSQAQSSHPSTEATPFQASSTNPADTDAMDFTFTPAPPRARIEMMDIDDAQGIMNAQEKQREADRVAERERAIDRMQD